jgi:hypothetical protein
MEFIIGKRSICDLKVQNTIPTKKWISPTAKKPNHSLLIQTPNTSASATLIKKMQKNNAKHTMMAPKMSDSKSESFSANSNFNELTRLMPYLLSVVAKASALANIFSIAFTLFCHI